MVMTGIFGAFSLRSFAISGALEGEIAIATTSGRDQQILDDLHFARLVGARGRPGIEACVAARGIFAVPFLAAEMDLLEERIVETLDHDGQGLVLGEGRSGERGERGTGQNIVFNLFIGTPPICARCRPAPRPRRPVQPGYQALRGSFGGGWHVQAELISFFGWQDGRPPNSALRGCCPSSC